MSKCMKHYGPICHHCLEPATKNFQKIWVEWQVKPGYKYSKRCKIRGMDIEEPTGDDNRYFCDECAEKFENGDI